MDHKLNKLNLLYELYDETTAACNTICKGGCSTCCTRNVTLTSLEAQLLFQTLDGPVLTCIIHRLNAVKDETCWVPSLTLNQIAERLLNGQDIPEEENNPEWGVCAILTDDFCPVYSARPFGCRCMMSKVLCAETGYADMDPYTVTVNQVFLQYIEHLDTGGLFGNFIHMMHLFSDDRIRDAHIKNGLGKETAGSMLVNHPIRMLLVPPEHQKQIRPLLQSIQHILSD